MWDQCSKSFKSLTELVGHVNLEHLQVTSPAGMNAEPQTQPQPTTQGPVQNYGQDIHCPWGDCQLPTLQLHASDSSFAENTHSSFPQESLSLLASHLMQDHLGLPCLFPGYQQQSAAAPQSQLLQTHDSRWAPPYFDNHPQDHVKPTASTSPSTPQELSLSPSGIAALSASVNSLPHKHGCMNKEFLAALAPKGDGSPEDETRAANLSKFETFLREKFKDNPDSLHNPWRDEHRAHIPPRAASPAVAVPSSRVGPPPEAASTSASVSTARSSTPSHTPGPLTPPDSSSTGSPLSAPAPAPALAASPASDAHPCRWSGCTLSFSSAAFLTEHISTVHVGTGRARYSCLWAGCDRHDDAARGFTSKQKVLRHIQSHTGHRPFVCDVCGLGFSEAATLGQHVRRHNQTSECGAQYRGNGRVMGLGLTSRDLQSRMSATSRDVARRSR
jgi:hypothetical protein